MKIFGLWEKLTKAIFSANSNTIELNPGSPTATRVVTLPDATDTLVGKATTDALTNKTFDANATGNVLSNVETADLASGVLNVSTTLATASDTQIPSALATKTYVDDSVAGKDDAAEISNTPSGNLAANTVQGALDELQTELDTATAHISDPTGAHAASAIANTPAGNLAATDAQGALNELQTELDTATAHISDPTAAHAASAIANTPSGNLAATDAQGALNELQTELDAATTHVAATSAHGATGNLFGLGDNPQFTSTESIKVPTGNTAGRPGAPAQGQFRFNTTETAFEGYDGTEWAAVGGGGLAVEFKTANFTAAAGIWYFCSNGVSIVTLPPLTDGDEIAFSPARGSEWSATGITVTPDGSDSIDDDGANSYILNLSGVDKVTLVGDLASTNWEVITPVTPSTIGNGAIVGPWASYTPSAVLGFTLDSSRLQWRQSGENIEIKGDFTSSAPNGSEFRLGLPNAYTVDFKSTSGAQVVGQAIMNSSSTITPILLATDGDTYLNWGNNNNSASQVSLTPVSGDTILGGPITTVNASVPVAEFAGSGTTLTACDFSAKTKTVDNTIIGATSTNANVLQLEGASERDSNGEYWFTFSGHFGYSDGAQDPRTITISSITLDSGAITAQAFSVSSNNGPVGLKGQTSGTTSFIIDSESTGWDDCTFSGKVKLSAKPSWFDANAENNFNIDIHFQEATPTVLGLVKADKIQTKHLVANSSNPGASNLISFNGLTIGNMYKMEVTVGTQLNGVGTQLTYTIDQNDISTGQQPFHDHYNGEGTLSLRVTSFVLTFISSATTVNFAVLSSNAGTIVNGENGGKMRTYATLTSYGTPPVVTTDFT